MCRILSSSTRDVFSKLNYDKGDYACTVIDDIMKIVFFVFNHNQNDVIMPKSMCRFHF